MDCTELVYEHELRLNKGAKAEKFRTIHEMARTIVGVPVLVLVEGEYMLLAPDDEC